MPIFFEHDVDATTRLAIWKIEEAEEFFLSMVPLQRQITHPHKRLQHLAGRYLLRRLFPDFPTELIQLADTRKPFLPDEAYHFSISHCGDFAAAIVSKNKRVGIDAELFSEKVQRIRHKFISFEEEKILTAQSAGEQVKMATLIWSCKEAIFKWYALGGLDFRTDMPLCKITELPDECWKTNFHFKKNGEEWIPLHSRFFPGLCLSYIAT
jgi:phosphopantetheinyl transferase